MVLLLNDLSKAEKIPMKTKCKNYKQEFWKEKRFSIKNYLKKMLFLPFSD